MSPLYSLLLKNVKFVWMKIHQNSFDSIKVSLSSDTLLQHFNPNYETCLETDASSYGLGAVLMQRASSSGSWLPVQFASRTLNSSEKNYSQIEKEALSVIFGTDKFCKFLLGAHFKIYNDHKPLHTLFAKTKAIPNSCSARVLRWALKLSQFDYEFVYSKGSDNVQSDCLSRLPLPVTAPESEPFELVFALDSISDKLISHELIQWHSEQDSDFILLKEYIKYGCPLRISNATISKIKSNIPHMTILKGCILYYDRIFIPPSLRQEVLHKFHENHSGMVAMKCLVRELIWYPGLDKDLVRNCLSCQSVRAKPPQTAHLSYGTPSRPFDRVHVDHFFMRAKLVSLL